MKFVVSDHAIQRFHERVKPALSLDAAKRELEVLVRLAGIPGHKPDWLYLPEEATRATDAYLTLSDGIVAPVVGRHITSVITRAGSNATHRANKNRARAKRRARRKKLPYRPGMGKEKGIKWR